MFVAFTKSPRARILFKVTLENQAWFLVWFSIDKLESFRFVKDGVVIKTFSNLLRFTLML